MRLPLLLAALLASSAAAQTAAPHALPFASAGNVLELSLGGASALDEAVPQASRVRMVVEPLRAAAAEARVQRLTVAR
jgi:hypothetical protein